MEGAHHHVQGSQAHPAAAGVLVKGPKPRVVRLQTRWQGDETETLFQYPQRSLHEVHYAQRVGIPKGRFRPSDFGM
jgi:hypothetical protein